MSRTEFLALLSKKMAGTLSGEEDRQFFAALADDGHRRIYETIMSYNGNIATDPGNDARIAQLWKKINAAEVIPETPQISMPGIFRWTYLLRIAAIFILIGAAVSFYFLLHKGQSDFETLVTTNEKGSAVLADGTRIWLNKGSIVRYNAVFGETKREIQLTGEAYFDVAPNANVPLYISAGNIKIEVKGTAFNIRAYETNPEIKVSLVHGSIKITDLGSRFSGITLKPNEEFILREGEDVAKRFDILPVTVDRLLSTVKWKADTLIFNKEKLKDLIGKMEKKYLVKIEVQSEQLKEKRFSGTFTTETIGQALDALKLSYPLNYTINKGQVIIRD